MKTTTLILLAAAVLSSVSAADVTITAAPENITVQPTTVVGPTSSANAPAPITTTISSPDNTWPEWLPLEPGAVRTMLLSKVKKARGWFSGNGINHLPNKPAVITAEYGSPSELLQKLGASSVVVGITDPDLPVTAHCQLLDEEDTILFEGVEDAEAVASGNEWKLVSPQIKLVAAWSFEIPLHDVAEAKVVIHDYYSDEVVYNLSVTDNGFIFPGWLYGRQGELVLTMGGGPVVVYSLSNGKHVTAQARGKSFGSLSNYTEVTADMTTPPVSIGNMIVNLSLYQKPEAPVFRVEVKDWRKTVVLNTKIESAGGSTSYTLPAWWYYEEKWGWEAMMPPASVTTDAATGVSRVTVVLDPGVYYIYAESSLFADTWWGDYGKG